MRDQIIQSAMRQMKKYGLRKFTVNDIAAELGISKKTIYKYFESKNEIIHGVLDNHFEMEKEYYRRTLSSEGPFLERLNQLIAESAVHDKEFPNELEAEMQIFFPEHWARCEESKVFHRKEIMNLLNQGVESGEVRSDIRPEIVELVIENIIDTLYNPQLLMKYDLTIKQTLEELCKMFLYGILANKKTERSADDDGKEEDPVDRPGAAGGGGDAAV